MRTPSSCPPGFQGRYTVLPGDSFYLIAQRFRISPQALIAANPHITNPARLIVGDVLCVPGRIPYPCCALLAPRGRVLPGTAGVAFAHLSFTGTQAVGVLANLQNPTTLGNFDSYVVEVAIPGVATYNERLFPNQEEPPTLSATFDLPTTAFLTPNTRITVRPSNSTTSAVGPVVLEGTLQQCGGR